MKHPSMARPLSRLAGGTAGILFAACALAQAPQVTPRQVFAFSGLTSPGDDQGAHPGKWARHAPVFAGDGRVYGATSDSSAHSRWFSVRPDGSDYRASVLVEPITSVSPGAVSIGSGAEVRIYGYANAGRSGTGSALTKPFVATPAAGPVAFEALDAQQGAAAVGQFIASVAAGAAGQAFYASRSGTRPLIWRMNAQRQFELIADFGRTEYVTMVKNILGMDVIDRYTKGQNTLAMAWSEAEQALYGVTEDVSVNGKSGDTATVPGDKAVGTLYRIKSFKTDGSSEIEVLHTFAAARDGTPKNMEYRAPGLVVAGDWIYGSTTAGVRSSDGKATQDGRIWRLHKDCVSTASNNCLEIVHRFDTAGALAAADGGALPLGTMVYAADGSVYGTTHRSGARMNTAGTIALGAGTLFRIARPTAEKLADVSFQQVHAFDVARIGAFPGGLSLGGKANGKQTILGAVEYGGSADNTLTTEQGAYGSGFGAVFAFDVDLPPASITAFTAAGSAARATVAADAKVTLAWSTDGAAVCEAGGDWSGAQQASGTAEVGPLAYREQGYRYTLVCTSADGAVSSPSQVEVTVEAPPAPTPVADGGGGGSLPVPAAWLLAALAGWGAFRRRGAVRG